LKEHSLSTLTRQIALEWDGNTSLREYASIDEGAAEMLAGYDGLDLVLGLTSLSRPTAGALSRQKNGSLCLNGLTSLDDGIAEEFSRYTGFLGLDGLASLSAAAAQALSKSVQSLSLSGLGSVPDPVAEVFSKCKCRLTLGGLAELNHAGLAAKLLVLEQYEELDLSRLTKISEPAATVLSKSQNKLRLDSLKSIPNFDLAWKLFLQEPHSSWLAALTSLSAEEAAIISTFTGEIYLENLTDLSEMAAERLCGHKGILGLRGLTSLTDGAAEALSKHSNILILPQDMSKKVADHFLRRFTGGIHQTNQMARPDGERRAIELKHGKLYDCKIDSEYGGEENASIVQLAIDATSNRRFVLFGAREIYLKEPDFVHKLIDLDFYFLFMEEYPSSNSEYSIQAMFLNKDGVTLEDESEDGCLYHFKETSVI